MDNNLEAPRIVICSYLYPGGPAFVTNDKGTAQTFDSLYQADQHIEDKKLNDHAAVWFPATLQQLVVPRSR